MTGGYYDDTCSLCGAPSYTDEDGGHYNDACVKRLFILLVTERVKVERLQPWRLRFAAMACEHREAPGMPCYCNPCEARREESGQ